MPRAGQFPGKGEATEVASLLSSVDRQARDNMRLFLTGAINVPDFMPYLRAELKRVLFAVSGPRLKATVRDRLSAFATTWGVETRGDDPFTIQWRGSFSLRQAEEVEKAAALAGVPRARYIRMAVMQAVARDLGYNNDEGDGK